MLRVARGVEDLPSPQEDAEPNSSPLGMGISAATMRKQREDADAPLAQQGQVVVNVGGSGGNAGLTSGGGDLVDQLAAYVVAASDFERQSRLRTAVRILHSTTSSDAERKHLAERLDAAVNAKRPKRDESGGVARAARVAFDKIAGIFTNED